MPDINKLPGRFSDTMFGLQVLTDVNLVIRRWVFPVRRFVEYGPEDESWARCAGYGHEITEPSKQVFRFGNKLLLHPATLDALKRQLEHQNQQIERELTGTTDDRDFVRW